MISDFVPGETVPRRVLRLVGERGIGELVAGQLGESLGRLHAIDPDDVTVPLRTLDPKDPTGAALAVLTEAVDALPQRRPVLELGLRWLDRRLPPPPERVSIVHTDVRNGNVIVGDDGLRAVLDWEGALAAGDPMQDLAWPALRMWRFREDGKEISGFAGRAPYVAGYERAGGGSTPIASSGGRSRARCAGPSGWPGRRWRTSTAACRASSWPPAAAGCRSWSGTC